MNYTSAALGVIALISLLTWITTGRKAFTGPILDDTPSVSDTTKDAKRSTDSSVKEKGTSALTTIDSVH